LLLGEVADEYGTPDDFIGHAGNDNFVIITYSSRATALKDRLIERFNDEVKQHYTFIDRERGHIVMENGETKPLMTLGVGIVSNATQRFADIREITELAAEARRRPTSDSVEPIETSW
jgi:GGDEF domain-containing protein